MCVCMYEYTVCVCVCVCVCVVTPTYHLHLLLCTFHLKVWAFGVLVWKEDMFCLYFCTMCIAFAFITN